MCCYGYRLECLTKGISNEEYAALVIYILEALNQMFIFSVVYSESRSYKTLKWEG